ncbi:MAG: hypothetical protein ACYT04_93950, partial [Nostoc sp.]
MSYDSNAVEDGVSGGPVFDENGEFVIGIHGKGSDTASIIPTIDRIFKQNQSLTYQAAATPINTFLDQLLGGKKYRRE